MNPKYIIKTFFADRYDSGSKLSAWLPRTSHQNNISKTYCFKGYTQTEIRSDCFHVLVPKEKLEKVSMFDI